MSMCSIPMAPARGRPSFSSWTGLGIRPEMHAMARRLAAAGYYVVAAQSLLPGRPLAAPGRRESVHRRCGKGKIVRKFIKQLTPGVVVRDAGAWLQFLSQQPQVKGSKVGAVGYCMGGAIVMRAAAHYPDRIVAGASFHGGGLGADSPDSPHNLAPKIRAKLHIGLAKTNDWMTPEMVDRMNGRFGQSRSGLSGGGLSGHPAWLGGGGHAGL